MNGKDKFTDFIYHYKGEWGVDSKCGLKLAKTSNGITIVIATDLYDENPGTSVTSWNASLATAIAKEYKIPALQLYFVEHTPDRGSKLTFYKETFFHVSFQWDGEKFTQPDWQAVTREEIEELLSS